MNALLELSELPSDWKVLPFLDVFYDATSKGIKVKKENYDPEGKLPVVDQGKQMFGGFTGIENKVDIKLPVIVFGDHTKIFKLIDTEFAVGADGVKLLEPKIEADKKFLYFYLNQLQLEDAGYSRHFKFLKETYIPLPPLETQKQIAAVLEKADQLHKDCQQMEQELNSLAQSVFIDMFGDPVTNPKKLTQQNILECLNVTTGKLDSSAAVDDGAFPFFTCAKTASKIDKYAFDQEALLLAGNNAQGIYDVKYYKGKFNAYQRTYVLSLKDNRGSFRYFQFALEFQLKKLQQQSKGSNTKYITMGIMEDTYLQIPDYLDQKKFSDIYLKIFEQLELLNIQKEANEANLNALMQQAFKGKLNLTDAPH